MGNLNKMKVIFSAIVLTVILVLLSNFFPPSEDVPSQTTAQNEEQFPEKIGKEIHRIPASAEMIKAEIYKPEIARSAVKKNNFQDVPYHAPSESFGSGHGFSASPPLMETVQNHSFEPPHNPGHEEEKTASSLTKSNPSKSTETVYGPYYKTSENKRSGIKNNTESSGLNTNGSNSGSSAIVPNTCSASISGGSFNHPIGVSLSCSSASVITYCLGKDTGSGCCDPYASGTTYSTKIPIGATDANYCLSFYGTSSQLGSSEVYQHNYTINSTLPDLQIGHQQNYYQTTQLSGKVYLSSLDFGKTGFGAGIINLKSHDPGPLGLDMKCDEIVQSYGNLIAPAPLDVLALLDVGLETPATQLEIPLRLDQMDYGTNYITGYMMNDNYDLPVYSCSTSEVVLSDFEFFEQQLSFGDPGNNTTREFTGGLTSFGFFEPEATLYRGPAGASTEDQTGEKLQYGMLGIFF